MTIQELLNELGVPQAPDGHHHTTDGWFQTDCIWCSPDSESYRLGINLQYGNCNCWSCGPHSFLEFLVHQTGKSWDECKEMLSDLDRRNVVFTNETEQRRGKLELPGGIVPIRAIHKNYLRKRGFNPKKIVKLWDVKGFMLHNTYSWSLFIPIIYKGKVVSYTTRETRDDGIRYRNCPKEKEAIPSKHLLYGEDYARHSVIVVEGCMDVWAIGPGAIATMGVAYTKQQLEKIAKYPLRVICFDAEREAQKRAIALCDELEPLPGRTINVELSTGKDASRSKAEEVGRLRSLAFGPWIDR